MLHSDILDASLQYLIDNTSHVYLCNNHPTTYQEAVDTYMLGYKEGPTFASPDDDGEGGRFVQLEAITDGVAQNTGNVLYVVLVDDSEDKVLHIKILDAPEEVQSGQPFTTTAMTIGIGLGE